MSPENHKTNIIWYKIYHKRVDKGIQDEAKTRAPRGTDRSPEYNKYLCYKLDSRVKILTKEWNEKRHHFITHASRSLL